VINEVSNLYTAKNIYSVSLLLMLGVFDGILLSGTAVLEPQCAVKQIMCILCLYYKHTTKTKGKVSSETSASMSGYDYTIWVPCKMYSHHAYISEKNILPSKCMPII